MVTLYPAAAIDDADAVAGSLNNHRGAVLADMHQSGAIAIGYAGYSVCKSMAWNPF